MDSKPKKINSLESLQEEKARLTALASIQKDVLLDDMDFVKDRLSASGLMNMAATGIVPDSVRHSPIVNGPINYVARKLFNVREDVVDGNSDQGKGNRARNIALGIAETVGSYLLTRYLGKKL